MQKPWQDMLRYLGQTNGAVDLSPDSQDSPGKAPSWRCRMLAFDGERIVLQRPEPPEAIRYLRSGEPVAVGIVDENYRWLLLTHVRGMSHYQLNDKTRVPAVVIEHPHTVRSGQRREFYRVPAVGCDVDSIVMLPDGADADSDAKSFNATLVNVSGGGIGVSAPSNVGSRVALDDAYVCRIMLPMLKFPLMIPVQIKRIDETERGRYYLGLQFNFAEDEPGAQRLIDEICRFAAHLQRIQIRMMRQKQ
jgi:c-di-GMP-binding flagellar brake protein YcgR